MAFRSGLLGVGCVRSWCGVESAVRARPPVIYLSRNMLYFVCEASSFYWHGRAAVATMLTLLAVGVVLWNAQQCLIPCPREREVVQTRVQTTNACIHARFCPSICTHGQVWTSRPVTPLNLSFQVPKSADRDCGPFFSSPQPTATRQWNLVPN